MSAAIRMRTAALPVAATLLVGAVLGVQEARGGGEFVPARSADPCAARSVSSTSPGIQALGEQLVLLGLDGAACRLGVTREALALDLAAPGQRTDAQVDALRAGLLDAVDRMNAEGALPKPSTLVDDALDAADLPTLVAFAIRALPDSVIDAALSTDDVARRAIQNLDLPRLLRQLDDPDALTRQLEAAVTDAVRDALIARVRSFLP